MIFAFWRECRRWGIPQSDVLLELTFKWGVLIEICYIKQGKPRINFVVIFNQNTLVCKFGFLEKLICRSTYFRHAKRKKKSNQKVFNWKPHFPSKIDAVENFLADLYLTFLDQNSVVGLREADRGFLLLLLRCLFFHSWHLPGFPAIFNLVIILAIAAFYSVQNASSHWTQLAGDMCRLKVSFKRFQIPSKPRGFKARCLSNLASFILVRF